jgi:hypothetical protein
LLYEQACDRGIIKDRVEFLRSGCPQVNVSRLSAAEFASLAKEVTEAPISLTKKLVSPKVTVADGSAGRVVVEGVCVACGKDNRWEDVPLFSGSFITCHNCKQKYTTLLTGDLRATIDSNLARLLDTHRKLAVWGVNYHTMDLVGGSAVLRDPNVHLIDISETKQRLTVSDKRINSPDIIEREGIQAVVVAVPARSTQIAAQVRSQHPGVQEIIDIRTLVSKNE